MKSKKKEKIRIEFKLVADQPDISSIIITGIVMVVAIGALWLMIKYL
jgi:hypothetical protein